METSDVRKGVLATIARAKRAAEERRIRNDVAQKQFATFLDRVATPLFRQLSMVLKAEGLAYDVFTPGGSVRLMSERSGQDYVEISLDTSGKQAAVICHTSRSRGRRILESERPIGSGPIDGLTEQDLLATILDELEPFLEK